MSVTGCGAPKTVITQVWQAPQNTAPRMSTLLVLGARVDEPTRRSIEDAFAADLALHGVRATPSYMLWPGDLPPIDEARAQVNEKHYDGIFVLTLHGVQEDTRYVGGHGGFWDGYYGGWGHPGAPGQLVIEKKVIFEATLWDVRDDDRLVWTARTETPKPSSRGDELASSLPRGIQPELVRAGFLAPKG